MNIIAHKNKKIKTYKIFILISSYFNIAFFIKTYDIQTLINQNNYNFNRYINKTYKLNSD